jgi:transmembrane sensor
LQIVWVFPKAGWKNNWRNHSPSHNQAYEKIARLWHNLDALLQAWRQQQTISTDTFDEQLFKQPENPVKRIRPTSTKKRQLHVLTVAASFILAILLSLFPDYWRNPWADYRTLIGEQSSLTLADGSIVHLNSGTAINTRFTANTRQVVLLRGEAEFEVAHDRNRPFTVSSGDIHTQAIGTKFIVRYEGEEGLTSLLEGKIRCFSKAGVNQSGSAFIMMPGQQAPFRKNRIGSPSRIDTANADAWKNGRLLMNFVTLEQAIQEINRYRRGAVKVLDDKLAKREINAAIDLKHIKVWLDALETTLPVKVRHFGPVILIRSRS